MKFNQIVFLAGLLGSAGFTHAQTTAITYQGRLNSAGGAATGLYDFTFNLYATSGGGSALTTAVNTNAVPVTNGLFTVTLDFGNQYSGADRWLGIAVRTNGAGGFTTLTPRQPLTPTPYAIRAASAGIATMASSVAAGAVNGSALAGGAVDSAKIADGSIAANDLSFAVLSNTFWRLAGNAGTTPAANFLGTTDGQALRLQAAGGIGVGTTTPGAQIDVSTAGGDTFPQLQLNQTSLTDYARLRLTQGGLYGRRWDLGGISNRFVLYSGHFGREFLACDTNGISLGNANNLYFGANRRQMVNLWNAEFGLGIQDFTLYQRSAGQFAWFLNGTHSNTAGEPGPGGSQQMLLSNIGDLYVRQSIVVDNAALNDGGNRPALVFGPGSGEFIASVRGTNGANRWGMDFYTGFQKQLTILNGGNVGIGTATPQTKLDVAGTIRSTGLQLAPGAVNGAFLTSDATGNASWNSNLRLDNVSTGTGLNVIYSQNFVIGGQNVLSDGIIGATIAGGGNARNFPLSSSPNAASGSYAAVGGGAGNLAGLYGTVPGGLANSAAGDYSFAAGRRAKANHAGAFVLADSQNADFASSWNNQFVIRALGGVGINTTTPAADLEVNGSTVVRDGLYVTGGGVDIDTGAGSVQVRNDNGFTAGLNLTGGPNPGVLRLRNSVEVWPNDAGSQAGRIDVRNTAGSATITLDGGSGEATVKILNITGGADIAEPFQMSHAKEIPKGAVVVIDEENPGHLKMSDGAYDTRVAGIVSGANGVNPGLALQQQGVIEGGQNVALTGRVYALADASSAPIKAGDLLTTSDTPGHVMKVSDRERGSGAILGKAMTALQDGKGMVLVLVSLQ